MSRSTRLNGRIPQARHSNAGDAPGGRAPGLKHRLDGASADVSGVTRQM
jgi:hypothetical protein